MARRYSCKVAAILSAASGGTVFAHALSHQTGGAAMTPDEWFFNVRDVPPAGTSILHLVAVGTTSITVAANTGICTADVFASIVHSICE